MKICVFCGTSRGNDPKFVESARELGELIAKNGHELVYGGANKGLMNELADGAKHYSGKITGVITPALRVLGVFRTDLHELKETPTYATRKQELFDASDAFIALPGGFGTLDELLNIAIDQQFKSYSHDEGDFVRPICVINLDGFYNGLVEQFDTSIKAGFMAENHRDLVKFVNTPEEALTYLTNYKPIAADGVRWWEKHDKPVAATPTGPSA